MLTKTSNNFIRRFLLAMGAFAIAISLPAIAQAHIGHDIGHGEAIGFMHGLEHPIGGLDHILAMVAVGLWAAQLGGHAVWSVPLAFVGAMALGGVLGINGATIPFVEQLRFGHAYFLDLATSYVCVRLAVGKILAAARACASACARFCVCGCEAAST